MIEECAHGGTVARGIFDTMPVSHDASLSAKRQSPNLASQAMGAALQALTDQ